MRSRGKMNFVLILFGLVHFGRAQPSIDLQLIGTEITIDQQSELDFCESKYCLTDSDYLFIAATQNKSVRPCDDFREFSLGSFIKYQAISDRTDKIGFISDNEELYLLRLKRLLVERINSKDTRVTSAMKKWYAKYVSSDYLRQHGVNEIREYLETFALKFYPETDQDDFDLSRYFENAPAHALFQLLHSKLLRTNDQLHLRQFHFGSQDFYYSSYEVMLFEMFQVSFKNTRDANKFKKDFHEIATEQSKFHELQEAFVTDDGDSSENSPEAVNMTIEELNNLTATLKLDWSKIINNQLLTKLRTDEKILIESPETIRNLTEFLASADKKAIADFLVYDFLFLSADNLITYANDPWEKEIRGIKRSRERWYRCVQNLIADMNPALMFLYSSGYSDEVQEESIKKFITELKEFAARKIEEENLLDKKITDDLIERVNSIKLTVGYPKEFREPKKNEEMYSHMLLSDQSLLNMTLEIELNSEKLKLEPEVSEIRKLIDMTVSEHNVFLYLPFQDAMFIPFQYLGYPFYHPQRPRFFNTATVGKFFFTALGENLTGYLKKVHNVDNFHMFDDEQQIGYEFYDAWLQSGGKELLLGAHRLTNQQLYWFAAARIHHVKQREGEENNPDENSKLHEFFYKKSGFRKAFNCQENQETKRK